MHRVNAIGNLLGVRRELAKVSGVCQDGAREFARRRLRITERLSGVAEKLVGRLTMIGAIKLQPDDRPRSSLSIGPGLGRCSGISPEFARRFAKGIEKLAGNMLGDCRKKTIGLIARMPKATGLARVRS
ncbi:hypothetical protein B296_00004512 [Ensete ventricosum]|uniref:Uncharacterized protein n=1 Tax=Ensete ventricosum TaxID=4639 RepID=A0A426XPJ7_ENSVE|nr:hypothetical protein B296_00004512 [Ensete ventricosum]